MISVIIIIGIIALITVPITIRVIGEARKRSFLITAEGIVKATNLSLADNGEDYNTYFESHESVIFKFSKSEGKEGESIDEIGGKKVKIPFDGKSPIGGEVRLYPNGDVEVVNLTDGKYYVNKDVDTELTITDNSSTLTRDELQKALESVQEEIKKLKEKDQSLDEKNASQDKRDDEIESKITNVDVLNKTYPVGSIYISENSTNPSTLFGGTWISYGTGRTLVGINTGDSNFNTVGKTGGKLTFNNSHTHTVASHTHTINSHTHTIAAHKHLQTMGANNDYIYALYGSDGGLSGREIITSNNYRFNPTGGILSETRASLYYTAEAGGGSTGGSGTLTTNGNSAQTTSISGSSSESLLQPYITVYMWKRTA